MVFKLNNLFKGNFATRCASGLVLESTIIYIKGATISDGYAGFLGSFKY